MQLNQRHTSQALSSLLAALVLLVAVAGKSWSVVSLPAEKEKTEQSSEKDNPSEKSTDDKTTVSELSLHAVVTPALSFDFAQSLFVLPHNFLHRLEDKVAIPLAARTSHYYFAYFRHVFGHHIAPNGP